MSIYIYSYGDVCVCCLLLIFLKRRKTNTTFYHTENSRKEIIRYIFMFGFGFLPSFFFFVCSQDDIYSRHNNILRDELQFKTDNKHKQMLNINSTEPE